MIKYLALSLVIFAITPTYAGDIAYIYGDVGSDGSIPSIGNPYDPMRLNDNGNTGCTQFRDMVLAANHTITEHYDQTTTFDESFLSQYDAIIFGLHQRILTNTEKLALEAWINLGGNVMFYSDSASGGKYNVVGAQNSTGQSSVNSFTSAHGMEVTVDQAHGVREQISSTSTTHPIINGEALSIIGEGVSPVAIDKNDPDIQILISYPQSDIRHTQGLSIPSNDREYASLAIKTVGQGNIIVMFDRQPVWNNGPGSSINSGDNRTILENIVNFMAGSTNQAPTVEYLDNSNWVLTASHNSIDTIKAIDDVDTSRWATKAFQTPGQTFNIDLGETEAFDSMILDSTGNPNDYPRGYIVRVSIDGNSFTEVTSGNGSEPVTTIDLNEQQNARYIQIEQTGSSNKHWWSIHELYITKNVNTEPTELNSSNWVLASTDNNPEVNNAIDSNDSSRWTTKAKQAPGQVLAIDLGTSQSFDKIILDSTASPNDYPKAYTVRVSTDGVNYNDVTSGSGTFEVTEINLPTQQNARYIQIEQTATTDFYWWSVHELKIFSNSSSSQGPVDLNPSNWFISSSNNTANTFKAIDQDDSSRWSTKEKQTPGQTFTIDLGASESFDVITLDSTDSPNDYPRGYTVKVSTDGVNYNEVTSGSGTFGVTEINLPTQQNARYIQIEQTTTTDFYWWSIHNLTITKK
ncbi:MAG: discoidin domain-containing protein [Lentisphaeraceae bacterium]|nr:discoidin domain-containing protein [Lentisphaeraceae bacterium]